MKRTSAVSLRFGSGWVCDAFAVMAPSKDAVSPYQEALLKLEKSAENCDALLAAARILKLNLNENALSVSNRNSFEIINHPAPKEEWVLRWLLKRLKIRVYRVQPLSYALLEKLLQRISRRAIAATFVEYKFAQLLGNIVDDLENVVFMQLRSLGLLVDSSNRVHSGSETSETIERSPIWSKKRKRENDDKDEDSIDIEMVDMDQGPTEIDVAIDSCFRFMETIYLLMRLVNDQRDEDGNVSHFQLRQSLRLDPTSIAQIVGKLFRISAGLVVKLAKDKRKDQLLQLFKTMTSCFSLWDLKKTGINGVDKNHVNAAFAKFCFIDALRLHLVIISTGIVVDGVTFITHSIEKLIALHVVLPARSMFMERGGSGIDYSKDEDPDWSAVQPVTANFKPLFEDPSGVEIDCDGILVDRANQDTCIFAATWRPAELIPTFYNIVARSVPRDSFRRQTAEASWLETAFVALAELAYSKTRDLSGDTSRFIPLLEQLFIVVRARKINLSLHTLLTHAAYTGLLKGKERPEDVRWNLTTLLIDLGADIFLPNSGFKDSGRLLHALFQSLIHIRNDNVDRETYKIIKERVVTPLLQAFAAARDIITFVGFWHEQLCEIENTRGLVPKETYSVWEDDDIATAYHEAIRGTLSDANLKSQIETAIPVIVTTSGHISSSPESYAHFVILEAGSCTWGNRGLPGLRIDLVTNLMEAIHKTISTHADNLHWVWRLWRFATNLIPISFIDSSNTPNHLATESTQRALQATNVADVTQYHESERNILLESFAACRFLLTITSELYHDTSPERKSHLNDLIERVTGTFDFILQDKLCGWNGRIQDLNTAAQLGTAYVECLMEFPDLLSQLSYKEMKGFVRFFWSLASARVSGTTEYVSFRQLWSIFVSYGYLTENPLLASMIARALCEIFIDMTETKQSHSSIKQYLPGVLQDLPGIPVRLSEVPNFRKTVEAVVTKIDGGLYQFVPNAISLITRWCQETQRVDPLVNEFVTSDLELLDSPTDIRTIDSFRSLIDTTFKCDYRHCKSSEDRYKYLKRFYKLAASRFSVAEAELKLHPSDMAYSLSLTPVFLGAYLRLLSEHIEEEFSNSKTSKDTIRLRGKMLELLLARGSTLSKDLAYDVVNDIPNEAQLTHGLAITRQILEDFDDSVFLRNIEDDESFSLSSEDISKFRLCLQNICRKRRISKTIDADSLNLNDSRLLEDIDLCRMQASEQRSFAREATAKLKRMTNIERIKTIYDLKTSGFEGPTGAIRLLLVGLAVSVVDEIAEKDSEEAREVSSLCTAVTDLLHSENGVEQFSLAAECLDIILRLHPRGVSQFNIDNCLTAITMTMSRVLSKEENRSKISPEFASTIFTRLCRILGTIVGLYRQQLGGRFHILLPALQNLLKALFVPSAKHNNSRRGRGIGLDVSHATQFTRLLTSLCDPTTSAVSRPSRPGFRSGHGQSHDGLIDQTKKAKIIAGQHLRILVECYAQNMLEVPLKPEIKTALAPGLYAILDAMSPESKRALNAGMDVSSRAIFKTLHEDYVRFGKWNSKG